MTASADPIAASMPAAMSSQGSQQIVSDPGHHIQIDWPDIVIAAIDRIAT